MARELMPMDPFRELRAIREELDRVFDSFFGRSSLPAEREVLWVPAMDVEERDDAFVVRLELPGLKKDEVKISITDNVLTVSGERKEERSEEEKTYHRREIFYGRFHRAVTLPSEVEGDRAKAVYRDGILEITIPKSERVRPKTIEIEVK